MHKTTDHLANQNNSNELDTTSLERAQDLELVQDKFQIENLFNALFFNLLSSNLKLGRQILCTNQIQNGPYHPKM